MGLAHAAQTPMLSPARRIKIERLSIDDGLDDNVVEQLRNGKHVFHGLSTPQFDQHRPAFDADLLEQGYQKKRFVLAVAVAALDDDVRSRWPVRTFTERYRKISNLRLYEFEGRTDPFVVRGHGAELPDELPQFVVAYAFGLEKSASPRNNVIPACIFRKLEPAIDDV